MTPTVEVAAYQKAKLGNYYCGDSYIYMTTDDEFICAIADGLGSGEYALESSQIAIDIIKHSAESTVEEIVKKCNQELKGKRGVVLGILKIHYDANTFSFSSIGNIGFFTVVDHRKKNRYIPNGGYLGGYQHSLKVIAGTLLPEMNFIIFSDGVTDEELSESFFLEQNVNYVVDSYKRCCQSERKDDTTLIAVSYEQ